MDEACIFKLQYWEEYDDCIKTSYKHGNSHIHSIMKASRTDRNVLCTQLEQQLADNEELTMHFHKNCLSRHASITNLVKHKLDVDESKQ